MLIAISSVPIQVCAKDEKKSNFSEFSAELSVDFRIFYSKMVDKWEKVVISGNKWV